MCQFGQFLTNFVCADVTEKASGDRLRIHGARAPGDQSRKARQADVRSQENPRQASGDRWLSEVSRHREKQTRLWLQRQPLVGRTGDRTLVCKIRNGTRCVFLWESLLLLQVGSHQLVQAWTMSPSLYLTTASFPFEFSFDVISLLFLRVPAVNSRVAHPATEVSSSCEAFSASLAASLLPLVVQVVQSVPPSE